MKSLSLSILLVTAVVVILWIVGQAMGFHVSLIWSLLISLALTLGLNLVFSYGRRAS